MAFPAGILALCALLPLLACSARPPNVVLIVADDQVRLPPKRAVCACATHGSGASVYRLCLSHRCLQGYADIGYHNSTVLTPRIDELAHAGVRLEGWYVQPVCSPTRSSLMTGRYTYRLGTQATVIRADVPFGVPLKETFVAENMKDAGCEGDARCAPPSHGLYPCTRGGALNTASMACMQRRI